MALSPDTITAVHRADLGAVVGSLTPQSYTRRVVTMALVGPAGSSFSLYRGYVVDAAQLLVTTSRGARNTYDAGGESVVITPGEAITAVWSGGAAVAGATARVTIMSEVR